MDAFILFILFVGGQIFRLQVTPSIALLGLDIGVFVFVLYHILRNKLSAKKSYFYPSLIFFAVSFVLSYISILGIYDISAYMVGVAYIVRFFSYAFLALVISHDTRGKIYWLSWLYIASVFLAIAGCIQLWLYPDIRNLSYLGWDPHYLRMVSSFLDPNFLGLILVLSLFTGMYIQASVKKMKNILWMSQTLLFVSLLLTYSRSSYVAFLSGIVLYIILAKKWVIGIVVAFLIGIMLILPPIGGISTSLNRLWTIEARLGNAKEAIDIITASPIVGHGYNMLRFLPRRNGTDAERIAHELGGFDASILTLAASAGTVGLLVFGYFLYQIIILGTSIWKKERNFSYLYFTCIAAILIHGIFLNSFFYPWTLFIFWMLLGLAEKLHFDKK